MRTLTRPMFNMGGPIKQGIMHGIREPYKHGTRAALVGNPVFPKDKTGRAHHGYWLIPQALRMIGSQVAKKGIGSAAQAEMAKKALASAGKTIAGKGTGTATGIAAAAPTGFKGYLMRDPLVKSALWAKDAIFNPTTAGWGKSALRFATAPSSLALGAYMGGKKLFGGDDAIDAPTPGTGVPGGGDPGMTYTSPEKEIKVLSDDERKAFANKQRSERVQKYLDMMGYDRSKKTAIADALIDASKIVSDRGTLDLKNIGTDLINPIIQATSKRLDKPDQIREAVGLMATKAEIEKDLNKETKDLDRRYKKAQIAVAEKGLEATESFEGGLRAFLSDRKGTVDKTTLERIARLLANEHGETFTKVTDETDVTTLDDGIYMSEGKVIRITGGVPKQIV